MAVLHYPYNHYPGRRRTINRIAVFLPGYVFAGLVLVEAHQGHEVGGDAEFREDPLHCFGLLHDARQVKGGL